jgi:hypothetical protein
MVFSDALTHFDEAEVLSLITDDIETIAKGRWKVSPWM